ncbi:MULTISPECIES: HEAT repeat domain-containing protein [Dehalococcoides]|uniref:HEAT repeat domain-containing protein n=2 Tax=Dehalococcoides mccartyi TaxID=61435 RepID=A0AB38ZBS6_9CHLR|nr:HEAT repeat domain-containing protein [Dehalococcoides mccartyi]AAW40498.1 PBS lyase HEAT-like repeat domain protein [Dehalococcoides mccartyi 195]WRO08046.1 HEAT repeat domain-containing protein [Dehalococcoides mccartyi]
MADTNFINQQLELLKDPDGLKRQSARLELEDLGSASVPYLVAKLDEYQGEALWESVKALSRIGDAASAPALVKLLSHEVSDIRWLASLGLIKIGREAVGPVLRALSLSDARSPFLREEAHHVLTSLRDKALKDDLSGVISALESNSPRSAVPVAAEEALLKLKL